MSGIAELMASVSESSSSEPASDQPTDEPTELEQGTEIPDKEEVHDPNEDVEDPETEEVEDEEPEEETYEVKVQGEKMSVTLEELKEGFMKGKDYSQKTAELAKERKQIAREQAVMEHNHQVIQRFIGDLSDPKKLFAALREVGPQVRQALDAALEQDKINFLEEIQMDDAQRAQRQRARQQAEFEERERQLRERQEAMDADEEHKLWSRRIAKWTPAALEAAGFSSDSERVRKLFSKAVGDRIDETGRPLDEAGFKEVAQELAEEWPELLQKAEETTVPKKKKGGHPPSAPRRSSGGKRRSNGKREEPKARKYAGDFFGDLHRGKF